MDFLKELGIGEKNSGAYMGEWAANPGGELLTSYSPATGEPIATIEQANKATYDEVVDRAAKAFKSWRNLPAPARGEYVRQIGNALREHKAALGKLVSLEMGKILTEGEGEVQESIDIADFAVGLSRQLYGNVMQSERPQHRMYEQWHPLGPVGIVTAFNFPNAVWAWNAMLAAICGDTMVWKPSPNAPLTAIATQNIVHEVMKDTGYADVFGMVVGGAELGQAIAEDKRLPLVSFTGSCAVGKGVAATIAGRFGRSILELGGNNAMVVMDDADLDMSLMAVLFGAVGTAGQRCTSTRRVFMQKGIANKLTEGLLKAYPSISIGDPLDRDTLMGPLVNQGAVDNYLNALERVKAEGGEILYGGRVLDRPGFFVEPTIVKARHDMDVVHDETFAPIVYLLEFETLDEVIEQHNAVPQGLSSAIFTRNVLQAETFLSARGSDCGIANVNIGTSGAEIGGAFGGEKETGGGREAGSDSWKAYMRRQTSTINWSTELPLAQGVKFDL